MHGVSVLYFLALSGNSFVEDDNGRLFYVKGCVNERPTVCDEDKPLMTTTIRRELPAMEDVEFERLDQLSRGKLRHFLLGSPSGMSLARILPFYQISSVPRLFVDRASGDDSCVRTALEGVGEKAY